MKIIYADIINIYSMITSLGLKIRDERLNKS